MPTSLIDQVRDALLTFTASSRLYELTVGEERKGRLLVEAFAADEQLQHTGSRDIICLSTDAFIAPASLLGQVARLQISLANRSRTGFHGLITQACMLGSNGGLTRYRIRVQPWLWQLSQVRNSRAWEEKTVIEIVDDVFEAYSPQAQWRWSDEVGPFMDAGMPRSYCCQYRETDLDFVTRLLTEEGLAWRFEDIEDGHRLVIFADSGQLSAVPEDPSSADGGGIRYHAAHLGEASDTIQSMTTHRNIMAGTSTLLSYDYKAKKIVKASVPTKMAAGKNMPHMEYFDAPGQYAFANASQAERHALLQAEALESRAATWQFRSTVRTLRCGTHFTLNDCPFTRDGAAPTYMVWRVRSIGVNNLPTLAAEGLAELFGAIPELLGEALLTADPEYLERAIRQATDSGYANWFDALISDTPWRPMHGDAEGVEHTCPTPTAWGSQSAIVVGRDGETVPSGADEVYCDALGRIRVRFHWQDPNSNAGTWVRVAQRSAGGGMGVQFIPRIGMEVHGQFIENDIDRPVVVGALYNGCGESDDQAFVGAHDHAASGQGNLASGNSPVWHGASPGTAGHSNKAALWGVRSKEFGGRGYNQLLFDDTDEQGRVQLRSTHAGSELNLGHLIHGADNYRGSFRGTGAELRTDDYGSVRAGAGLLISSYKMRHAGNARDPAGDNAAGIAMLKQATKLAETFSQTAVTHLTVGLASHMGSEKVNTSVLDDKESPLKALLTAASGMLSGDSLKGARADAGAKATAPADGKLPHSTDPIVAIAAQAGLGVSAGQDMQLASGEMVTLMSGQDSEMVAAGKLRVHTGQAIGVLGGAMAAGDNGLGLQLIAAQDDVDVQAQADLMKVQARDLVSVISANAHIDWAAAKSISMSTSGGANITISGGDIIVQCPGKIMVHAGKHSLTGPAKTSYPLPVMPSSEPLTEPVNFKLILSDIPGKHGLPLPDRPWDIVLLKSATSDPIDAREWRKTLFTGISDGTGECMLTDEDKPKLWSIVQRYPNSVCIVSGTNAIPISFSKCTTSASEKSDRTVIDALNYGVSEDHLDQVHKTLLKHWVEQDYNAKLSSDLKTDTKV